MLQELHPDVSMPVATRLWVQEEAQDAGTRKRQAERVAFLYQLQDGLDATVSTCPSPGTASLGSVIAKGLVANATESVMIYRGLCAPPDDESWSQEFLRRMMSWPSRQALRLQRLYHLRNATAIDAFLDLHPVLVDVLVQAYPHLERHFVVSAPIPLELVQDAEAADRATLFVYIPTTLLAAEARVRLYEFDDEWFLDQIERVGSLLNFNLEFT